VAVVGNLFQFLGCLKLDQQETLFSLLLGINRLSGADRPDPADRWLIEYYPARYRYLMQIK
jgi:hypothetical protein